MPKVLAVGVRFWIAAALAAIAVAIYSDSLWNGFTLDSSFILLHDPRIQKATTDNLTLILTKDYWFPNFYSELYRPFTTLTFLFNYAVLGNGSNPFGYHLVNLLLHVGNAWLVFALAWRFLRRLWPAFFAAALWTAHPIATEAVANLVGRCDELAAMAILGGVLLYVRSATLTGGRRWLAAAALFVISLLGLFSKELATVLIAMMLLWDLVRGPNTVREWVERRWPYYAAAMASLAIFAAARIMVFRAAPPAEIPMVDNPLVAAPFWLARLTAFKVLLGDLWLLVFPLNLSSDRSYNQIPLATGFDVAAWGGLLIAVVLLAVAVARRRKDPLMFWCAGFFGIALLPVSNLAIVIGSIMAERFLYLPAAAFAIAAAVLIYRSPIRRYAPIGYRLRSSCSARAPSFAIGIGRTTIRSQRTTCASPRPASNCMAWWRGPCSRRTSPTSMKPFPKRKRPGRLCAACRQPRCSRKPQQTWECFTASKAIPWAVPERLGALNGIASRSAFWKRRGAIHRSRATPMTTCKRRKASRWRCAWNAPISI
jgi:protein O-mannosyl-transferase